MGLKPGSSQADMLAKANALQNDPGQAMLKMLGGGDKKKFPANIIQELNKYFHPICVKSCTIGMVDTTNAEGEEVKTYADDYVFRKTYWPGYRADMGFSPNWGTGPAPGNRSVQQMTWDSLFINVLTDELHPVSPAMLSYAEADCPYPPSLCVPLNAMVEDMQMTNIDAPGSEGAGFCVPTVETAQKAANAAAMASEEVANAIPPDFAERSQDFVGAAVGELYVARWTFVIMAFVGLVIGVVYLVLMRYIVGPLVWISLTGVAVLLFAGAGLLYLQSIKCLEPPEAMATAGGGGNGTNGSRILRMTSYEFQKSYDFAARALSESTNTTEEEAGHPFHGKCPDECLSGCEISSQLARQACVVGAAIIVGFALFYLCCLLCNYNRINLAIALNQVAAKFVAQQPYSLIIPPVQIIIVFLYLILWIFLTIMIVSYVPDYFQVDQGNFTYEEAYGIEATGWLSSGTPGKCWENDNKIYQVQVHDDQYGGRAAINETTGTNIYRCVLMAYVGGQDYR